MVSESSPLSFEEFISTFAYKGGGGDATIIGASRAAASRAKILADGKKRKASALPGAPITPPPLPHRRRSSPHDSYIRVTIGGKSKVVSKYFPLPPTASNPIPISVPRKRKKRAPSPSSSATRSQPHGNAHDDLIEPHEELGKKKKKKPLLSAAEKRNDAYRRVSDDNTWVPPKSGYNLLQESYYSDPWKVLVICMLLNLTTGKQVRRVLPSLFLLCPDAETATGVPEEDIERVIESLGLHRKRAKMIKRFSQEYLGDKWTHVTELHGVGKYAADAYAIFCVGKPEAVTPEDHKLMDYWKFVCGKEDSVAIKENQHLSGTSGDDSVA